MKKVQTKSCPEGMANHSVQCQGSGAAGQGLRSPPSGAKLKHLISTKLRSRDGANLLPAVVQSNFVIPLFDPNKLTDQTSSCENTKVFESYVAGSGNLTNNGAGRVFDSRQDCWAFARAWMPSRNRRKVAEGFVRANGIVDLSTPTIQICIEVEE
jgi:hypothetical protein